jgi:hypothetical protein
LVRESTTAAAPPPVAQAAQGVQHVTASNSRGSAGSRWWAWGVSDVWPLHFTVVMHASVLLGATGAVWAVLNALWGQWQVRHGEAACFFNA